MKGRGGEKILSARKKLILKNLGTYAAYNKKKLILEGGYNISRGGRKISRIFFYEIFESLIPTDAYYPRSALLLLFTIKNPWNKEG